MITSIESLLAGFVLGSLATALLFFWRTRQQNLTLQTQWSSEKEGLQKSYQNLQLQLVQREQELQSEIKLLQQNLGFVEEQTKSQLNTQMNAQMSAQEELFKRTTLHFENLAQRIFEDKSSRFTVQNQENLNQLLAPLKERIKDFEKRVEETYSAERSERGVLRGEISKLVELNQVMSRETKNLTQALKGENKTQGNWGELILENILERSGLRKNEEYTVQAIDMQLRGPDGQILRPDVIVNLPDNKHLVVDSKMTLNSFEAYISAESEDEKLQYGKLFTESLKRHIDGLSSKKYHLADSLISPDFVLLFMPLEPAFSLAFQLKPELFQDAWEKNVAIVSPTTLLTSLRTVAALWKQDRQQKNALEIAKRGGALYDKFVGLVDDLEDLGQKIENSKNAYQSVFTKLSTGRGNLIGQVEQLKKLGAKTEKSLSPSLLEDSQPQ